MSDLLDGVPELRTGYLRRDLDGGCVVWSPVSTAPTALDPVATVMLDVIDGEASIGQLANEVHEEVGVPARRRPPAGRAHRAALRGGRAVDVVRRDVPSARRAHAPRVLRRPAQPLNGGSQSPRWGDLPEPQLRREPATDHVRLATGRPTIALGSRGAR